MRFRPLLTIALVSAGVSLTGASPVLATTAADDGLLPGTNPAWASQAPSGSDVIWGNVNGTARSRRVSGSKLTRTKPGPVKVAVLLINFPTDRFSTDVTEKVRGKMFTGEQSANKFYQSQSGGTVSIVGKNNVAGGDMYGWLQTDFTPVADACDYTGIDKAGRAAAAASNIDLSGYDVVTWLFPRLQGCPWAGLTGGGTAYNGSVIWLNGTYTPQVLTHELGHAFGAPHASSYACTNNGSPVTLSDTCTKDEYGDPFDTMGCCALSQMGAWLRDRVGELPDADRLMVKKSTTVTLGSVDDILTPNTKLVLLPRLANEQHATQFYALDTRSASPFNLGLSPAALNGVTIRLVGPRDEWNNTLLLDMHPHGQNWDEFNDAPLLPGETFTDTAAGITIRNVQSGGGSATVEITTPDRPDDPDTTAPDPIENIDGNFTAGTVKLSWDGTALLEDPTFDHYEVFRQGKLLAKTSVQSYQDATWLSLPSARASYQVFTVDQAGNRSSSEKIQVPLPYLSLSASKQGAAKMRLTVKQHVGPAALPVQLTVLSYKRVCRGRSCRLRASGKITTKKLTWKATQRLTFRRPRPGQMKFTLQVGTRKAQKLTYVSR